MKYMAEEMERNAALQVAALMTAAIRTAPKACGVDTLETIILDGKEKDALAEKMAALADEYGAEFFRRDAANIKDSICVVLAGARKSYRGLGNCGFCGKENCGEAIKDGVSCAYSGVDLGIAIGSAVAIASDHHIDNRVMFSAGKAAIEMGLFSKKPSMAFVIPLSISKKSIYFDRGIVSPSKPIFVD